MPLSASTRTRVAGILEPARRRSSMRMPMMDVRKVRVAMREGFVPMAMRVRFGAVPIEIVRVPMVVVMPMRMEVVDGVVQMLVLVDFGHMQPDANGHQRRCNAELQCDGVTTHEDCQHRAEERSDREIRTGACRAELPKRDDEQREAEPIAQKADGRGLRNQWAAGNCIPQCRRK